MTTTVPFVLRFVAIDGAHPVPDRQRYATQDIALVCAANVASEREDLSIWIRERDGEWAKIHGPTSCPICVVALDADGMCTACDARRRAEEMAKSAVSTEHR
jgi:hypothetical protein